MHKILQNWGPICLTSISLPARLRDSSAPPKCPVHPCSVPSATTTPQPERASHQIRYFTYTAPGIKAELCEGPLLQQLSTLAAHENHQGAVQTHQAVPQTMKSAPLGWDQASVCSKFFRVFQLQPRLTPPALLPSHSLFPFLRPPS